MENVQTQKQSMIISMDNKGNANSHDKSNKRSLMKDENICSTLFDGMDDRNVSPDGKIFLQEIPVEMTSSSSSTPNSDSEQEDPVKEEQEPNKDNYSRERLTRREKYFRKRFASEITDGIPKLVDCFLCAYQGDILLQGQMFITDRYLCFYSRIINYITKHTYRWEQIERVTKERVAYIFPTAIGIKLKDFRRKVIYASFLSRDVAYDKIIHAWSQDPSYTGSSGDGENCLAIDGSSKATNKHLRKYLKRNSCESVTASEPDEGLEMCLNGNNLNQQRFGSVSPRRLNEKQKSTILVNSTVKKSSGRNSVKTQKESNQLNEPEDNQTNKNGRRSGYTKRKSNADSTVTKRGQPLVAISPLETTPLLQQTTQINDQAISLSERTISHQTPSSPLISNPPTTHVNNTGIPVKILNIVLSLISLIIQTISSIFHRFHIHPTKTTILIFIIVTLVFFHSFYLVALAYRLENRLQTLHNRWPTSLLKSSLPSNSKQL